MDVEQLHREFPYFQAPNTRPHGVPLEVQPLRNLPSFQTIWEEDSEEEQAYWNGVFEADSPSNKRPPSLNTVLVVDADEASYTGSSDGLNDGETNGGFAPATADAENVINISDAVEQGPEPAVIENGNAPTLSQVSNGVTSPVIPSNEGPSLDLTLGIGINNNYANATIIEIGESDSEAEGDSGGFGSDPFF
ncbi:hypothetical protein Bca4012_082527 [Brassica carinata]